MRVPKRRTLADLDLSTLSPEWRPLVAAIRVLLHQAGPLRLIAHGIAEKLDRLRKEKGDDALGNRLVYGYLTRSVLSDWSRGKRKRAPKEVQLKELHEFVLETVSADVDVIPWDELLQLLLNAKAKPASSTSAIAANVVPVSSHDADRHNNEHRDIAWPTARTLSEYIAKGSLERVSGLIRHVGTEAEPVETAAAVVACRGIGLSEAGDAVIDYASRRSYGDVLQIARLLIRRDMRADADMLLERAITTLNGAQVAA